MQLLKKAMTSDFWQEVREKSCFEGYRRDLHTMWQSYGSGSIPELKYSDFKLFFTTGDRSIYEKPYFDRRRALDCAALLSLIYPHEPAYLDRLMDVIYAICDESTWCLPAHQGTIDKNDNGVIDLFAAETGLYLAEIDTLLGDRLDPLIRDRIRVEIDRRIFTSFAKTQPYSHWETGLSNWTAVCMGSVACTLMLMRPDTAQKLLPRFEASMACFLRGYGDDGVCQEGGSYWNYGFGFFLLYADMVRTFTQGEIDHFKSPKVKAIATFYQKTLLSGNSCISFADANAEGAVNLGRTHYLMREYPDEVVMPDGPFTYTETAKFSIHLRSALWFSEDFAASDLPNCEFYAPDAEWFIKRTASYGFAAKGGHNQEPHNHNDVGSFIFAKNGRQLICDLGFGLYTRQYFGRERYDIFEPSSRSHSLPIVDGRYQYAGKQFCARGISVGDGSFSLDLAVAYNRPDERILRTFTCAEDSVTLTDTFEVKEGAAVTERIVTKFKPVCTEGKVCIEELTLTYDATLWDCSVSTEQATKDGSLCYLIDFTPKGEIAAFVCRMA